MDSDQEEFRKCKKCGLEKKISEFPIRRDYKKECRNYRCGSCNDCERKCLNLKSKKYRDKNPDKVAARKKEYAIKCGQKPKSRKFSRSVELFFMSHDLRMCSDCKVLKLSKEFPSKRKTKKCHDMFCKRCIKCLKKYDNKRSIIYRQNNPEKCKQAVNNYRVKNRKKYCQLQKEYASRNKEKIALYRKEHYQVRKLDPVFSIRKNLSKAIHSALRENNSSKKGESILKFLSYTMQDLRNHLESLFEPWMSWENWGAYVPKEWNDNDSSTWKWQIDHIIPHSKFKYTSMDSEEFKKCWSLSNLRPLSAKQNILDGTNRIRHITKE